MGIRTMTIEDVNKHEEKIVNLFEQLISANFPENLDFHEYIHSKPAEMRKYIQDGTAIIFGAFKDNELAGLIWGYKKNYFGELRVHIAHTVVDEKLRSSSVHVGLAFKMRNEAKRLGAVAIECMATYDNDKLVEHYQRIGFQIERVSMVKPL